MADGITVGIGVDSSQVNTGLSALNDQLAKTRTQINGTAASTGALARAQREQAAASSKSGQNMLQLAYAVDDAQYGMRGIMNNIPMLAQSLGLGAGIAGVASIAAVAISFLYDKISKLGPGAKNAADAMSQAAQATENAQARVAAALRARIELEKEAKSQSELSAYSLGLTERALDAQAKEIERGNKAIQDRIKLDGELNAANKDLEIAKLDASGKNDTQKIVEKAAIEAKYAKLSNDSKLQALQAQSDMANKEIALQNEIQRKAGESSDKRSDATKKLESAEKRAADLEIENQGRKLRAINLYNQAKASGRNIDDKFDPKKASVEELLVEAGRMNTLSLTPNGKLNREIGTERGLGSTIESRLADAKSEVKMWHDQLKAIGDPDKSMIAASDRKKELQAQLEAVQKQEASLKEIARIEAETAKAKEGAALQELATKQQKDRDDEDKRIAAQAMKIKAQAVSDSVSKIGGGGYVGTRAGTIDERIARAVEDSAKKQALQLEVQKQIRDKKPTYE